MQRCQNAPTPRPLHIHDFFTAPLETWEGSDRRKARATRLGDAMFRHHIYLDDGLNIGLGVFWPALEGVRSDEGRSAEVIMRTSRWKPFSSCIMPRKAPRNTIFIVHLSGPRNLAATRSHQVSGARSGRGQCERACESMFRDFYCSLLGSTAAGSSSQWLSTTCPSILPISVCRKVVPLLVTFA